MDLKSINFGKDGVKIWLFCFRNPLKYLKIKEFFLSGLYRGYAFLKINPLKNPNKNFLFII